MKLFRRLSFVAAFVALAFSAGAQTAATDPVVCAIREELDLSMEQLKTKPVPAYFMSLRMNDVYEKVVYSNFGVESSQEDHNCSITPQIRLGSPDFDNFKYECQTGRDDIVSVPYTDNAIMAIRQGIWKGAMDCYDRSVVRFNEAVSKMRTNADNEDKAPCFAFSPAEQHYEAPMPESAYSLDTDKWAKTLNRVSSVFADCKYLEIGQAILDFNVERSYVVNSVGSVVVQNRKSARLMLFGQIRAVDGMACPLYKDWFGFSLEELPDEETLVAEAKDLLERLLALREAPIADPYSGPAILDGAASGVFFHEIFGHRLEAHRMKSGGQTFKKLVGETILPADFQVYDDPSLKEYAGLSLNGHYLYDDEAVKAQRVQCVENGVLKNFLVGSTPIDGFPASNGHGRGYSGFDPVSRQSNLIIETSHPYTSEELRAMLIDQVKKEGKEYGYYFRTATSGLTYTGEGGSINSFGVDPVEVYRVFADGRPDQLVRGVTLIGTPLAMFSGIAAGGDTPSVFTGNCGAESGWVPVTAISPMIYVSKIETQRSSTGFELPQILEMPEHRDVTGDDATIVFSAMGDEMVRTLTDLKPEGMEPPFYADFQVVASKELSVKSSLGGLVASRYIPKNLIGTTSLMIGDNMCANSPSQTGISMNDRADYDGIRRGLWLLNDNMYKRAIHNYSQKVNMLQLNPKPQTEADIPEIIPMEGGEYIFDSCLDIPIDRKEMEELGKSLSSIYLDYPTLYDTEVNIMMSFRDVYRLNSEGLRVRVPDVAIRLSTLASVKTESGSVNTEIYNIPFDIRDYDAEEIAAKLREFAEAMVAKSEAETTDDYYIGPLLLEKFAVYEPFTSIVDKYATAQLTWAPGRQQREDKLTGGMLLGKRFLDSKLSMHFLSDLESYKGVKIDGAYKVDYDGVSPDPDFIFVENGILKNLMSGRYPGVGSDKPTGHAHFGSLYTPVPTVRMGTMVVSFDGAKPASKVKAQLISEAKKSGLNYAYILSSTSYDCYLLKRIDVKTGIETLIHADTPDFGHRDLMHILSASKEDNVGKVQPNIAVIAPECVLLESVEMNLKKPAIEQEFQLVNPSLR